MPWPKLELSLKYLTATEARKRLKLSRFQFDIRLEKGIFPKPTYIDVVKRGKCTMDVRYFDEDWVGIAEQILACAVQKKKNQATVRPVA